MYENGKIYMGLADGARVELTYKELALNMCNRHGLIAGASGTGKTITMKVMAESFSDAGVPVFLCDVKGDVAGICAPGVSSEGMERRIDRFGLRGSFAYKGYPTTFWDIYQTGGHAVRATVSDMGPELLSRILSLTSAQEGILHIVFRIADDKGLLLLDLKDLRAMLNYVSEHRAEYMMTYGNITPQSVAAILRALLPLEQQGGDLFFGEPPLDIYDWMRTDADGRGMVNVLDCVKLVQNPTLYASFLLWMLSELFESLPEAGDLEKPKLVFFFDEAHTLFRDAPTVLVQKIEQTVKLIRSKGVGVFFVTQSPSDIPDAVLAQLSNRVQHALRAYTPTELKAVRVAAQAFRENPAFNAEDAIMELGVGEALQCPTILDNGFGGHRIEGIGDKHIPWIHNVKNTDMVIDIDDEDSQRLLRLFNTPEGQAYLKNELHLDDELIEKLTWLGISGIANVLCCIKMAKYYEFTERDVVGTVLTDSAVMYGSRIQELNDQYGAYNAHEAAMDHALHMLGLKLDNMQELTYADRKRVHNLKYYTWVEQQGKTVEELNALWYDTEGTWDTVHAQAKDLDDLINAFNEATGLLKDL